MPTLLDDPALLRRLVGFDSVVPNGPVPVAEFRRAEDLLDRLVYQSCTAEAT